jgi:hypothetical protein
MTIQQQQQQQQQQQRKFYPCRRNCGSQVTFDKAHKNQDGSKFVPLVEVTYSLGQKQLQAHQCPNRQQQQPQSQPSQLQLQQPQTQQQDLYKAVSEIKAQLQLVVLKLETLEGELEKK